jgi:hypothetical protein
MTKKELKFQKERMLELLRNKLPITLRVDVDPETKEQIRIARRIFKEAQVRDFVLK